MYTAQRNTHGNVIICKGEVVVSTKNSITKSRSGHYTVAISHPRFGLLFKATKLACIETARNILSEAQAKLLRGDNFALDYNCVYTVNVTNLNKYLSSLSTRAC